jgi:hypothetical protein
MQICETVLKIMLMKMKDNRPVKGMDGKLPYSNLISEDLIMYFKKESSY